MNLRTTLSAVSCLVVLGATPAVASSASATTPVKVIGGDAARSVSLDANGGGKDMVLNGKLRLAVRNVSAKPVRVRLRYQPSRQRSSILLPGSKPGLATLAGRDAKAKGGVRIGHGAVHAFTVAFTAAQASALDGAIDVETLGKDGVGTSRLELPVTAALRPIGDVRFDPSSAVAQITLGCPPSSCNTTTVASTVVLRGAGVDALLDRLAALGTTELTTTLRRDDGRPVQATLSQIKSDPDRAATATAKLALAEKPAPGKYTGKLPVSTLVANAPALPIEVRSRISVVWAIVFIFLGLFISGGALTWIALGRRRRQLRKLIRQAVGEYQADKDRNAPNGPYAEPLMWIPPMLADDLGQKPAWRFNDPLDSPSAMYTATSWARNDADLDEVQDKAVELALAVKEWRAALVQVLALRDLLTESRIAAKKWRRHSIVTDTDLLLRRARHEPADAAAQAKLMAQVAQQTRWYRHCAGAWDLKQQLERVDGLVNKAAVGVPLDDILNDPTPALTRTVEQQDALDVKLEAAVTRLAAIKDDALAAGYQVQDTVKRRPSENERLAGYYRAELGLVRSAGAALALVPSGSAAPSPTAALAATAGTLQSPLADDPGRLSGLALVPRVFRRYHLTDIALSFGILLLTAVVYGATVYDDTWGSLADLATAFGAGLLGKLTVQWTLLPIFRSLRLRRSVVAAGDTTAQAAALVGIAS